MPGNGPRADAMVTDRRGIALGIVTGDCAPVLFADADAGVVGAAHAGWRGAVAGVLEATLAAMHARGAVLGRIGAAIGPCIGQASYEVGADLRDVVLDRDPADARFFAPGHRAWHWQFDLPGYCAARLAAAGVGATRCWRSTRWPMRRGSSATAAARWPGGGLIGHQISVIALA